MKKWLLLMGALIVALKLRAQETEHKHDFPIVITVHFSALATPFRNVDLNFRNIGITIGTEVAFSATGNWLQQFQLGYIRNRSAGNQILAYTQSAWRPGGMHDFFGEIKAGVGYVYASTATPALQPSAGGWVRSRHRGKGMLAFPVGLAAGNHFEKGVSRYSPFVAYQFMLLTPYNATIPLIPQTMVQTGLIISR